VCGCRLCHLKKMGTRSRSTFRAAGFYLATSISGSNILTMKYVKRKGVSTPRLNYMNLMTKSLNFISDFRAKT